MAKQRLYSVKSLAELLDVSPSTIYKLVRLGHLAKPRKVANGSARWTKGMVDAYLARLEAGDFESEPTPRKPKPQS